MHAPSAGECVIPCAFSRSAWRREMGRSAACLTLLTGLPSCASCSGTHLRRLREARGISARQAAAQDPRVGLQDQPHRARPERHPRDRRARPADPVRRRPARARAAAHPGRAGQPAGLVAPVQRHPARLVPGLRRHGRGGAVDPRLRAAVHPRPAADRGVRGRRHRARRLSRRPGRAARACCARSGSAGSARASSSSGSIVDEAALRRPVAGIGVQLDQLRYLSGPERHARR